MNIDVIVRCVKRNPVLARKIAKQALAEKISMRSAIRKLLSEVITPSNSAFTK